MILFFLHTVPFRGLQLSVTHSSRSQSLSQRPRLCLRKKDRLLYSMASSEGGRSLSVLFSYRGTAVIQS